MKIKSIVIKDTATPAFQRLIRGVENPRGMMAAVGRRVVNDLRAHFDRKESAPPRSGWPKGHLWARVARNTNIRSLDARQVTVGVGGSDAGPIFLKRLNGGPIYPKEKKNLAVPINPQAAGKYPSANLIPGVFLTFRRTAGQLSKFLAIGDRNNPTGQVLLWALRKSVNHPADPTALPGKSVLLAGVNDEIGKFIERAGRR